MESFWICVWSVCKNNELYRRLALRNTGTLSMTSSPNIMDFYERTWKGYADATSTILTNFPVIKCQWLILTWLIVTTPCEWLIVCVIHYLLVKCQWLIVTWWNEGWSKVTKPRFVKNLTDTFLVGWLVEINNCSSQPNTISTIPCHWTLLRRKQQQVQWSWGTLVRIYKLIVYWPYF